MTKLIIFDLDGTLLDTLQDLADCTNFILRKYGFPEHPLDSYKYFVGNGIPVLIHKAVPEGTSKEVEESVLADFLPYYDLHKADLTAPYQGIVDLLEQLHQQQILIAVASNKIHDAMAPLMKYYFPSIPFLATLGNRVGVPPKPNPAIVEEIIGLSGFNKDEILYVGDTKVDMDTAQNAGLRAVGVLWGFRDREELEGASAEYIIQNPGELLDLLTRNSY
ncbi:MAG: phosphoglycolate phosphatase [Bacteroidetes bacterium]|nr:phosphoglycolate phosphatase [Bacteroidota bacterium]